MSERISRRHEHRARPAEPPEGVATGPGGYHNAPEEQTGHQHGTPGQPELASPEPSGPERDLAQGQQTQEGRGEPRREGRPRRPRGQGVQQR